MHPVDKRPPNESNEGEDARKEAAGPAVFIVATPIGNLDDLTPRAVKTLAAADVIAAEDTRNARKLLARCNVSGKRLVSYQDHGEEGRAQALVKEAVDKSLIIAVVSDAGTPCIADPGFRIVQAAREAGIPVHPVAGPSALTALVSASGLPSDRFLFVGFLPTRDAALRTELASWNAARSSDRGISVVFFEATRRLAKTLVVIGEVFPDARVAVGRELTKLFEEIVEVPVADALAWAESHASMRGEASVMVYLPPVEAAAGVDPDDLRRRAVRDFKSGATLKDLLLKYKDQGLKRPELYRLLLEAKDD